MNATAITAALPLKGLYIVWLLSGSGYLVVIDNSVCVGDRFAGQRKLSREGRAGWQAQARAQI